MRVTSRASFYRLFLRFEKLIAYTIIFGIIFASAIATIILTFLI